MRIAPETPQDEAQLNEDHDDRDDGDGDHASPAFTRMICADVSGHSLDMSSG